MVGQFAVAQAEVDTGIVLTTDGQRHSGVGEVYRIFSDLESARAFSRQLVSIKPQVECNVYDAGQTHIERIVRTSS